MKKTIMIIGFSILLMSTMFSVVQAERLYSATIPFFSGGLDLQTGIVQRDPTILLVLFGSDDEIEHILKNALGNLSDFSLYPEVDLHFEYDPASDAPIVFAPEEMMQVAVVEETFDFSMLGELEFQEIQAGELLAFEPSELLLIHTTPEMLLLDITAYTGIAPLTVEVKRFDAIPEPATLILLSLGIVGLIGILRRKRHRRYRMSLLLLLIFAGFSSPTAGQNQPDFNIGAIPPKTAWHGMTLEFQVHSDELGAEAALSINVIGSPNGLIAFNVSDGLFSYTPDAHDKTPFSVTFKATSGAKTVSQTIQITPVPDLPPEHEVFGLEPVHPLPDPEDTDYIACSAVESESSEDFNNTERTTRTISISGKQIVFEAEHANHLYNSYNGNDDIKAMTIYAETLIIRNPLHLPQTNVTIYAKDLRFEGSGELITTPRSTKTRPGQSENGKHGLKAGDITLYIGSFYSDPGHDTRFILQGGNGQPAGLGQDGADGVSREIVSDIGPAFRRVWGPRSCGDNGGAVYVYSCGSDMHFCREIGVKHWPTDGQDAIPAGKPGEGGLGGNLFSNSDIGMFAELSGGIAGEKGPMYSGGTAGEPNPAAYWLKIRSTSIISAYSEIECRYIDKGKDAVPPEAEAPVGVSGIFSQTGNQFSWLSPYALRMILAYAKDTYLYGYLDKTEEILAEYLDLLNLYAESDAWNAISEKWRFEFGQMREEMQTLQHRIASNLDYFGNPAGWAPMLSFEANKTAFENEIEHAIRVLYLAYWVRNAASDIQGKVDALTTARKKAKEEIEAFKSQYNTAMDLIPRLEVALIEISDQREYLLEQIEQRKQELEDQARRNVEDRHKVPFWKKAAGVLSAICMVSPVGQPALGTVGAGIKLISEIDLNDPWTKLKEVPDIAKIDFNKYGQSWKDLETEINKISVDTLETWWNRIRPRVEGISNAFKPVGEELQELEYILKETQIPDDEVKAELQKLKAADPEFNDLISKIDLLMAQKKEFAQKLAETIQIIATLSNSITHNLLAIDGMNRDIADGNAVLDHRAMIYLDGMERRAKERLLKYHYWMAKALEYRTLESYNGELNLNSLFEQFKTTTSFNGELTLSDFEALKSVYTEQLASIAEDILDDYNSNRNSNEFSTVTYFYLTSLDEQDKELLDALNSKKPITLNFMDESLFPSSREAIRLVKLEVVTMKVHLDGGTSVGSFGELILSMEHSGLSTLARKGKGYQFKHDNESTENPIIWRTTYHALDESLTQDEPSDAGKSLLRSILDITDQDVMLFSRPAGWANIVFQKAVNTDTNVDIVIDSLLLKVEYDYFEKPSHLASLDVGVSEEGLLPLFILDKPDNNNLQDGVGSFRRTYYKNSAVTVEAPSRYGIWRFEKWTDRYGNELDTDRSLKVILSNDEFVRAHFVEDAGSTEINLKQGNVEIEPGGVYGFGEVELGSNTSVTFILENPGDEPFIVYSIDMASSRFSLRAGGNFPLTIEPNSSIAFDIIYEPEEADLDATTVSIPNNEPSYNPFLFTVTGTGISTIDPSLILSFPFEEDGGGITIDTSKNGNDGIVHGAMFVPEKGVFNSHAYQFNWSSRDRIEVPYQESQTVTDALTLEAWIYPTAWDNIYAGYNRIVSKQPVYLLRGANGHAHFQILTENHGYQGVYADFMTLAHWHYVVGSFDGQNLKLYVDGVLQGTTQLPESDAIVTNEATIFVGECGGLNEGFTGRIDNVLISRRVKLSDEIEAAYNGGPILLEASKTGTGQGTILIGDQECGPECTELRIPYTDKTGIVLKAIPESGYRFVRWEKSDGSPVVDGVFRAQPGDSVIAIFEKIE